MVLGFLLEYIGDRLPLIKDYLGGGPLLSFSAAPAGIQRRHAGLDQGRHRHLHAGRRFLTFYICALICGSILGIEARLLVKAGARYVVPLTAAVVCAASWPPWWVCWPVRWREGISYVSFPIMGRRHGGRGHSHG